MHRRRWFCPLVLVAALATTLLPSAEASGVHTFVCVAKSTMRGSVFYEQFGTTRQPFWNWSMSIGGTCASENGQIDALTTVARPSPVFEFPGSATTSPDQPWQSWVVLVHLVGPDDLYIRQYWTGQGQSAGTFAIYRWIRTVRDGEIGGFEGTGVIARTHRGGTFAHPLITARLVFVMRNTEFPPGVPPSA
jgi:hypothetical protein